MKTIKIFITLLIMLAAIPALSQYTIPLRLVNSDGTPNTGEASNISFTRYPHSYPTDAVSGITVTEVGTAGNYVCKGFTTFEYVKLWLSGVEQTWFDSVQVGSITSYLSSNYMNKTSTQTGFSGTKTLTGSWAWTLGNQTLYNPYISSSNAWVADYSTIGSYSLLWKNYADSIYGVKPWFISGSKVILLAGYKIWGLGNSTPFQYNSEHFNWDATNGLQIDNPLNYDSLTIKKDTIITENTYSKLWSLKRRYYSQTDSMNLYWMYKNTYTNTSDSFAVINNKIDIADNNTYTRSVDSISVTPIDTFSLPGVGYWDVTVHFEYEFEYCTPANSGYDTLYVGIYHGDPSDVDNRLDYATYKFSFNSGIPWGIRNRSDLTFTYKITNGNYADEFYIAAITSGICQTASKSQKCFIRRNKVEAVRIR